MLQGPPETWNRDTLFAYQHFSWIQARLLPLGHWTRTLVTSLLNTNMLYHQCAEWAHFCPQSIAVIGDTSVVCGLQFSLLVHLLVISFVLSFLALCLFYNQKFSRKPFFDMLAEVMKALEPYRSMASCCFVHSFDYFVYLVVLPVL